VNRTLTILILVLLTSLEAFNQNYLQSAGVRLGASSGFTYRRMFDTNISGEIMLLSQNHGTVIAFLVEKHRPALLFNDLNLNFIWGLGAHLGMADRNEIYNDPYNYDNSYQYYNTIQLGFDGFVSFEYEMPRYPVSFSLEAKPYIEFFDDHFLGINLPVIAFGARYNF